MKLLYLTILIIGGLFLLTSNTEAIVLYLDTAKENYYQSEVLAIEARIDIEGECINALEGVIEFPQEVLQFQDFLKGGSILSLWLKEPAASGADGLLYFSGGAPGGFCGPLPGDPGQPNLLAKIIFQVKQEPIISQPAELKISFTQESRVLANDGLGSLLDSTNRPLILSILPGFVDLPADEFMEIKNKDRLPPQPFKIKLEKNQNVFEGRYFITFSTTDKQSGVDYYEVKEGDRAWKSADSPYLLLGQNLIDIIKVRAVDKAGNEQFAILEPEEQEAGWKVLVFLILLTGAGVLAFFRLYRLYGFLTTNKKNLP